VETVEWCKGQGLGEQYGGFEFSRAGTADCTVGVEIELDVQPALLEVRAPLSDLLGVTEATRADALASLYKYLARESLVEPAHVGPITPNEALIKVFGPEDATSISRLAARVGDFLAPFPPVRMEHRVEPGRGGTDSSMDICSVRICMPQLTVSEQDYHPHQRRPEDRQQLAQLSNELASLVSRADAIRRERTLLMAFADSPVDWWNQMLVLGGHDAREELRLEGPNWAAPQLESKVVRPSEMFQAPWVEGEALRYLYYKENEEKRVAAEAAVANEIAGGAEERKVGQAQPQRQTKRGRIQYGDM
jgi:hypothetical protein